MELSQHVTSHSTGNTLSPVTILKMLSEFGMRIAESLSRQ